MLMLGRMRRMQMRAGTLVLLFALLPGCSSSGPATEAADAATSADTVDAEPLCDSSHPGVRVHVTVTFGSQASCPYAGDPQAMGLGTTGPDGIRLSKTYPYYLGVAGLSPPYTVTTVLGYPEGTQAGPAGVGFYAIHSQYNWEGSSSFTADPQACVDVDLTISCIFIGSDAGP
jgi:hypothetical protein